MVEPFCVVLQQTLNQVGHQADCSTHQDIMKDDSARKALPDTVDLESPEDPAKLQDNTDKEPATLSDREDWHSKLPVTGDQTGKWCAQLKTYTKT